MIRAAVGGDAVAREAIEKKLTALRSQIAGPSPSPLEVLLVDRIVICWLQMAHADALCAQRIGRGSPAMEEQRERRQDRIHRRFLSAFKALAQVRRLLGPSVQVNIAQEQVNVCG